MKRREFIGAVGGALAWPGMARAQRRAHEADRRVHCSKSKDPEARNHADAFERGLTEAMTRTAKNPSGRKQLMAQVDQVRQALRAAEVSDEASASRPIDQVELATSSRSEVA
jgi:hypothetical protein